MLPNAERAILDSAKVRDYMLSSSHPVGRFKSVVFFALGYRAERWEVLRDDLLTHARLGAAIEMEPSAYGRKFPVSGNLTGPNGRSGRFKTTWSIDSGTKDPRFVTAYPE